MLNIIMLVAGIVILVRGKLNFTKNKVTTGAPAYIAGVILLLPLPLAFCVGFVLALRMQARDGVVDASRIAGTATAIEIGIIFVCLAIALTIAGIYAKPPLEEGRRKKKKRYEEYDDDDDDRPRKRRAKDDDDEDEDLPPRKARRVELEDDDEEDPPAGRAAKRVMTAAPSRTRPDRPPRRPNDDRIKE